MERELGKGAMGVVYQAVDQERKMRVALKTLLHLNEESLYTLKNEFRSLHDLVHPNLCSFMELIKDDTFWFVTMELVKGKSFIDYVSKEDRQEDPDDRPFDDGRLRSALAGLAEGLAALHRSGKVHRDVKPSNVLVTEDARVVLLDFGLVTPAEALDQRRTDEIAGTAAYMAPEQADAQTPQPAADWYSVGCMLYEALTGKLPFVGTPMKMVLEKQVYDPPRPSTIVAGVPPDLEDLCMLLLRRIPEERPDEKLIFQTLKIRRGVSLTAPGSTELPGTKHGKSFVGRRAEIDQLLDEYWKVREGVFRSVVIEGVSGVGKSALISRVSHKIKDDNPSTLILGGRCYERESSPLKAFDGIVEAIVQHLVRLEHDEIERLKPRNTAYFVRMFPGLKKLQPFADEAPPTGAIKDPVELQKSTYDAAREFFSLLCRRAPIVVIIDDVQWIDVDSLLLLHHLVGERDRPPFLLLLLSRVSLSEKSSGVDWSGILTTEPTQIQLERLNSEDADALARQLIGLHEIQGKVDPGALAREASGHPLYIAELVHHIASGAGDWRNLLLDDVIWHRVKTLPRLARHILEIVCVAGTRLSQEHLQTLCDLSGENFFKNIRLLDAVNLVRSQGPRKHHFVEPYHDRVRESVVDQLSKAGEATRIHLDIGRFFLHTYTEAELRDDIFNVTGHLHAARDLIHDQSEKRRLAELYFIAGQAAQQSAAYSSALSYFKLSIACFPKESWKESYDTMFALYSGAAEAAYITGDFALTTELIDEARAKARRVLDKAKIYETHILSLVAEGKPIQAIDAAVRMVRRLRVRLPYRPSKLYVLLGFFVSTLKLAKKTDEQLVGLPEMTNPYIVAVRRLIRVVVDQVYIFLPNLWVSMINQSLLLALKYGIDRDSSITFAGWGTINCAVLKKYEYGYRMGKVSLLMGERFGEHALNPMTNFVFAVFVQHWRDSLRDTLPVLLKGHRIAFKTGVISYEAYNGSYYCCHSFLAGNPLSAVIDDFAHYGTAIKNKKQYSAYNTNRIYYQAALNLSAPSRDPIRLEGIAYKESEKVPIHLEMDQKLNLFEYYFCSLLLAVFFRRFSDAYKVVSEANAVAGSARGLFASSAFLFYDSLACLNRLKDVDRRSRRKILRRVASNQRRYKKIAANSPKNHLHKYQLVEAERARVAQKPGKAEALFDAAIEAAIENKFVHEAALAAEFAAAYFSEGGLREKALLYARKSLDFYQQWGAGAKVELIEEKWGLERRESRTSAEPLS